MGFAFGAQTWPDRFMPALLKRVSDSVRGMTTDRVFQSVWSDEDHLRFPPADRFVAVRATQFPVDQRDVDGGGSINTAFDSTVVTTLFVRLEELENRSTRLMSDDSNGVYKAALELITGLQTWEGPVDPSTGLQHFRRPMRLSTGWSVQPKSGGQKDTRWSVVPVMWQVSFVSDLGNPYPS